MAVNRLGAFVAVLGVGFALGGGVAVAQDQQGEPVITDGPRIEGVPHVGATVTAVASWAGLAESVEWRWWRCGANAAGDLECDEIGDAREQSYVVTDADLGQRLVVRLTVRNDGGRDRAISEPTEPVAAAPPPSPPPPPPPPPPAPPAPGAGSGGVGGTGATQLRLMRPHPVVRVRGRLTPRGARITLMTIQAPKGARIAVRCRGRGCPSRAWRKRSTEALTRVSWFPRRVRAGTRLVVTVAKEGRIGKHTVIVIRRGKAPLRYDRCLVPGASRPQACPPA